MFRMIRSLNQIPFRAAQSPSRALICLHSSPPNSALEHSADLCHTFRQIMSNVKKLLEDRQKKKRDIILPNVISWEYGSNKFASQKGTGGMGNIRRTSLTIESSRGLTNSHDGNVPFHQCPPLKRTFSSQAGQNSFGSFRDNVMMDDEDKKTCREMLVDWKATERTMPLLSKPNEMAKNGDIGRRRGTVTTSLGGRVMTHQDSLKCKAALPRFQRMDNVMSLQEDSKLSGIEKIVGGLHHNRQIVTPVQGLDRTVSDQLASNRYMAWLGGQLTLQSQAQTGGFSKVRDVANRSYYDKVQPESGPKGWAKQEKKNQLNTIQVEVDADESVEETVRLEVNSGDEDTSE